MMPGKLRSKKGQIASLSTVLVVIVVIILVFSTYVWGRELLEQYEAKSSVNYAQGKLLEMRTDIMEVMHDGANATRVMQFDTGNGKLGILTGPSCSAGQPNSNGIFFELGTTRPIIDSTADSWLLIDPTDSDSSCEADYDSHNAGVLLTKGKVGGVSRQYITDYMLWFRNLTTASNEYSVSITPGGTTEVSGGIHSIVIRNMGTTSVGSSYTTNIQIDIN